MIETFVEKNFSNKSEALIDAANVIIYDFMEEGYRLTLRQLYYQMVSQNIVENTQRAYSNLGRLINDARLAGRIDWSAIEDRTRELDEQSHWDSASEIMMTAAHEFRYDKWQTQWNRIEVWIEKDALTGVIEKLCRKYDVPFLSCRGYLSQSVMYESAHRLADYLDRKQQPIIIQLSDHDPSGIDMLRDIRDRLEIFCVYDVEVIRVALNRDQVDELDLPPNPAKITDPRAKEYLTLYDDESWELDAMPPSVINELIEDQILNFMDKDQFEAATATEENEKQKIVRFIDEIK